MKINFDKDLHLAGIGVVPWPRLGPELWLKNYTIASFWGWDIDNLPSTPTNYVFSRSYPGIKPAKVNTPLLFGLDQFCDFLDEKLPDWDLMTYRPVSEIPSRLKNRKILMVDPDFTDKYENKAWFRDQFRDLVNFPKFRILERAGLTGDRLEFDGLLAGQAGFVIQDERLSGGKGTFVVRTLEEYRTALADLHDYSKSRRVVVSRVVEGARERSIQACVSRYGVFTGPLQRQIIAHPFLANLSVASGDKFCGAVVSREDQGGAAHQAATEVAQLIGQRLYQEGFRGIFGVDFLLDATGELFTLEVNPRITGVTPLLASIFEKSGGVPFYLLHLLELGNYDYTIEDDATRWSGEGSMILLHSLESVPVRIAQHPPTGTYKLRGEEVVQVSRNYHLANLKPDEFVLKGYASTGSRIKPGGRQVMLEFGQPIVDNETDKLYDGVVDTIKAVRRAIKTEIVS